MTKHGIDGIHDIASHHAYFIDDQQFQLLKHFSLFAIDAEPADQAIAANYLVSCPGKTSYLRNKWRKRQLEEGVYSYTARIDGGNTGRGHNSHLLGAVFAYVSEESRFPGSCLTG